MEQNELIIFIVLVNILLLILFGSVIAFVVQYRRRKIQHEQERELLNQQHQQELLNTQLEVQQQTMQDIGKELHDNVGQKLTLASIYTQRVIHTQNVSEFETQMVEIGKIINDSIQDIRQLSKSLVQPEFAQKSLLELLANEVIKVNQTGLCKLTLETIPPNILVDTFTKNNLYRLIQEFVQNSLKHAQCKHIWVNIEQTADSINLQLSDDGIGFDTKSTTLGIGLSNMKRRTTELNATHFELTSAIGKGTHLALTIKNNQL